MSGTNMMVTVPGSFVPKGAEQRQPQPQRQRSDPNMLSTESSTDELSPTAMILRYLAAHGQQPTAANISRVLQANALNPGQAGPYVVSEDLGPNSQYGSNQLRNAGVEDSAPAAAPRPKRAAPKMDNSRGEAKLTPQPGTPPPQDSTKYRGFDWLTEQGRPPTIEPPGAPAPVGGPPLRTPPPLQGANPEPTTAPVAPQPPGSLIERAISKALELPGPRQMLGLPPPGPPGQLALPAPTAAAPQLALPPPTPGLGNFGTPTQPAVPVAPEPAPVPQAPPVQAAPQAAPVPDPRAPQGPPGGRVRVRPKTPTPEPAPATAPAPGGYQSRLLEGFNQGGGVKGGIGGAGKFVPGLGGAIIGGSGLLDILHEWRRQHGQVPGG